ncbi:hypothetical protein [Microbacterium sp. Leaf203]|nr:hypothetical protein [Microbacterium sp. Leaf203]
MSIDRPVPVPRTAVPLGITDPVQSARAELKAALAAIEVKANAPRRVSEAIDRTVGEVREKAQQNPGAAAAAVAGVAALVGLAVWGIVRAYTRGDSAKRPASFGSRAASSSAGRPRRPRIRSGPVGARPRVRSRTARAAGPRSTPA